MSNKTKINAVYRTLSRTYTTFDKTDDPWMTNGLSSTPFRSIVSGALSTMTTTKRVVSACVPLFKKVSTFEELYALDDEELRAIIKPVAHYNKKTKSIKEMCRQIIEDFDGQLPNTKEDLLKLQGVGLKVASLIMNFIFEEPLIAVDTHIHRLLNRLGIVHTTSTDVTTREINELTPKDYKRHAHEWLIQHGMQICRARNPKCDECVIRSHCEFYAERRAA
ncbi:endonuclease III [Xanthomonas sp. WHRI 8391]|uniref:endonuclease III domain-containing protein n=1 Tax=Xanthomonas TaxID=338 RepID=UPI001A2AD262|nr:endonuclease III [Xanthomonas hortorum]MBG3850713.1 endonuclease III [Xanthomonas hortorum pv. carotae]UTS72955.1 endonuclease III [Xanthomonas hortorum]